MYKLKNIYSWEAFISTHIHICLSFDSLYAPHGDATITSIIKNCSEPHRLHFYIVHDEEFKPEIKEQLKRGRKDQTFTFLEVGKDTFNKFPLNRNYININCYYRLILQDLLPQNVDKYIYVDSDIIVIGDICEIWNENINEVTLLAAPDNNQRIEGQLGLPPNTYFNSGFLVFNLKRVREKFPNLFQIYIDVFEKNRDKIKFQDQDIINLAFYELSKSHPEVKMLSRDWNYSTGMFYKDTFFKNKMRFASDEAYLTSMSNSPRILHYTGRKKPWKVKCLHPLKGLYWKYRRLGNFPPTFLELLARAYFTLGFVHFKDLSLFLFKSGSFRIQWTRKKSSAAGPQDLD